MLERALSGNTAAWAIEVGVYRSRGLKMAVLERALSGDTAAGGYKSNGAIEVGVWKGLCWRERFRWK